MYKVKTTGFDERIYAEKIQRILDVPKTLEDKALDIAVATEAKLESIYETAPPRDDSKFIWSTDPEADARARGWWFAQIKKGAIPTNGKHYARQGKAPYSVILLLDQGQRGVSFQVKMNNPKERFVFGGLNGADIRNPSHKATGWNFASPLVNKALDDARRDLLSAMSEYLKDI